MQSFFLRYATPFITGFFLISLISGIGLFFHFGPSGFRGMHEWLSLVLILPFGLHIWKNWKPMLSYFKRTPMALALALSLLAALPFLIPTAGAEAGGPPQFQLARKLLAQPAPVVAAALGSTNEAVTKALTDAGIPLATPAQGLTEAATAAGKTDMDLAEALLKLGA
jgi:hypothetical protein